MALPPVLSSVASPAYAATTESHTKELVFNQRLIDQVGKQEASSVACLCYAAAYCQTIVTGEVTSWTYFDGNGGAYGENSAYGRNMSAEFEQVTTGSDARALELLYNAINDGHPCVIQVTTPGSSWHWVAVVGYVGVTDSNNLSIENFLMLDPGHYSSKTPETMEGCTFLHQGGTLGDMRISKGSVETTDTITTIDEPVDYTSHIAGAEAYHTAVNLSGATYDEGSCDSVILARDDSFEDSLSAAGLAGALDCPILLINRSAGVYSEVADEISRLGASTVYVIGGTGAIPADVEGQLSGLSVQRIAGQEAWDTSVCCAQKIMQVTGSSPRFSIVAMSDNFQDALSMSSFAFAYKVPIILETSESVGSRVLPEDSLGILNSTTERVYVAGGTGAVPETSLANINVGIERIGGWDGFDTSNQIATTLVEEGLLSYEHAVVANGSECLNGLDALSAAAYAGSRNAPILLANGNDDLGECDYTTVFGGDSEYDESFIDLYAEGISELVIIGGTTVMPTDFVSLVNSIWQSLY